MGETGGILKQEVTLEVRVLKLTIQNNLSKRTKALVERFACWTNGGESLRASAARPGAQDRNYLGPRTSFGFQRFGISALVASILLGGLALGLFGGDSAYAAFSASISRSGTVNLAESGSDSIRPTSSGTLGTGSDTVSVTTNCTYSGYKVYVSATSTGSTDLTLPGDADYIPTSSAATGSETTLGKDTWGVGKTASAFSGLPSYTANAGTLTPFYTGATSASYDFYYGVNVSTAKTPGTYGGEVLYTVLMNDACLKYTLNFNGNSATTNTLTSQDLTFDSTIDLSTISDSTKIARTGYTLTGWKDQSNNEYGTSGTADVNPSDLSSVTLTAQWQINSNNVTVSKGTNVTTTSGTGTYDYNSTVTISATAFSTGYHFSGWTVNSGGVTLYSNSSMTTTSTTSTPAYFKMPDNDVKVTANAAANTYTIAYNNGGGSGTAPTSQTNQAYGTSFTTRANTFSRTGYQFAGWSTTNGASSATCSASASCSVSTLASNAGVTGTNGATINLYAVWTPNTVTITYSANGGTGAASKTSETGKYGTNITMPTKNTLAKSGYDFLGWSLSSTATSATWTAGQTGVSPTAINSSLSSSTGLSTTVYAVWKSSTAYMQDFTCSGSGLSTGQQVTLVDRRDDHQYTVKKLPDGKCWMTQNLTLGDSSSTSAQRTLTSTYTNIDNNTTYYLPPAGKQGSITSSSTLTSTTAANFSSSNDNQAKTQFRTKNSSYTNDSDTGYYNFYTATLGYSYYGSGSSGSSTRDICPANWRLPWTSDSGTTRQGSAEFYTLALAYNSSSNVWTNYIAPTSTGSSSPYTSNSTVHTGIHNGAAANGNDYAGFSYSGYWNGTNSSASNLGSLGFYWSSSVYNTDYGYFLFFGSSNVGPQNGNLKYGGVAVRCVAKS